MSFVPEAHDLLEAASRVLRRSGFEVESGVQGANRGPTLLAENEFFAIGLLAGSSLHELAIAESLASEAVLERLGGSDGTAKRWDAYLVLLTPESSRDANDRERMSLTYNTRGLRRIIGQGLVPTDESLTRVLTPFLPLREPLDSSFGDIGSELAEALTINGIERERSERYVSAYLDTGSLDNV